MRPPGVPARLRALDCAVFGHLTEPRHADPGLMTTWCRSCGRVRCSTPELDALCWAVRDHGVWRVAARAGLRRRDVRAFLRDPGHSHLSAIQRVAGACDLRLTVEVTPSARVTAR